MIQKIKSKISGQDFFKVVKDFGNYFTADMATKAVAFLSIPVYTRLIDVSEYGIYSVFFSYAWFFTILFSLNIYSGVGRYFYEEKEDFNIFFGTSIILTILLLIINTTLIMLFRDKLSSYLELPKNLLFLFIPISIYQINQVLFRNINVALRKSLKISKLSLFFAISSFMISVVFLYFLDSKKYNAPIYAYAIIGILVSIYIIYDLKKYIKFSKPKKEHIKYMLSYSIPLIPYFLGDIILTQFDKIMINSMSGAKAAGLYSLAYNIGAILNAVTGAFFAAWIPNYYKKMDNKDYLSRDKDVARILKAVIFFAIALSYFGLEIGSLLADKKYHEGLHIVPIVIIGYTLLAIFQFYGIHSSYKKKTYWFSLIFLLSGIINIILNKIFIPTYGYVAGAYTTAISYFFLMIFGILVSKFLLKVKITPFKYVYYPILIYILSLIIYFILQSKVGNSSLIYNLSIKGVLFIGISILLFLENIKKLFLNYKI